MSDNKNLENNFDPRQINSNIPSENTEFEQSYIPLGNQNQSDTRNQSYAQSDTQNQSYAQSDTQNQSYVQSDTQNQSYAQSNTPGQPYAQSINYGESEDAAKAVEKERIKREKEEEIRRKKELKAAKKQAKKANGHGIIFKTTAVVASALLFSSVSLGVMYYGGDKLGFWDKKDTNIASTAVEKTNVGTTNIGTTNTLSDTDKSDNNAITTEKKNTSTSGVTVIDVSSVVEEVMPSVVAITSTTRIQSSVNDWYNFYFGFGNGNGGTYEQSGAGSGIIIGKNDKELIVLTNNHVVEGADSLQVKFIDDESVEANIKGTNASNDIAVVAIKLEDIKEATLDAIKIATLGDSKNVKVGEGTIAIGNALGYGQSVTSGVVSAVEREVTVDNYTMKLIQTDAAINPGNSGGALLNTNGEVIGINSAKYSSDSVEGMGFAIPISSVKDLIDDLMSKETLEKVDENEKGYLNIRGKNVTEELADMYNIPVGVYVVEAIDDGAADIAGIEKTDVIVEMDGATIESMEDLQEQLEYHKVGDKVEFKIMTIEDNEYVEKNVTVELEEQRD